MWFCLRLWPRDLPDYYRALNALTEVRHAQKSSRSRRSRPCRWHGGGITEVRRQETLLKTGALQSAIFNSANFSSIATDAKGVIQIFNVGAERMLGYAAAEVMNKLFLCTALNATESLRSTREDQK